MNLETFFKPKKENEQIVCLYAVLTFDADKVDIKKYSLNEWLNVHERAIAFNHKDIIEKSLEACGYHATKSFQNAYVFLEYFSEEKYGLHQKKYRIDINRHKSIIHETILSFDLKIGELLYLRSDFENQDDWKIAQKIHEKTLLFYKEGVVKSKQDFLPEGFISVITLAYMTKDYTETVHEEEKKTLREKAFEFLDSFDVNSVSVANLYKDIISCTEEDFSFVTDFESSEEQKQFPVELWKTVGRLLQPFLQECIQKYVFKKEKALV